MAKRDKPEPPFIAVVGERDSLLVRAALAGIEEEGVPFRLLAPIADVEVDAQARAAAERSPLEVGLSVIGTTLRLTHAKFEPGHVVELLEDADVTQARRIGHNAARIVTGVPLR